MWCRRLFLSFALVGFAIDGGILGAGDKPIAQLGGWLITDVAKVRAAGLISVA